MGKGIQTIALVKQVQTGVSQYESLLYLRLGGVRKDKLCIPKTRFDDVYRTTNYEFGWIDDYNGEKILFLDEFRSSCKIYPCQAV